jgi:hypothetical protein
MAYKFMADIEGQVCVRLGELLMETEYSNILISTNLPLRSMPSRMIWLTKVGGTTTEWGQQNVAFNIRCISDDYDEADDLAYTVRAYLDDDTVSFLQPITHCETTTPTQTNLLEGMDKYISFFSGTFHEVATLI